MSKIKRAVSLAVSFAMVIGCLGMFTGDLSQKLFRSEGGNNIVMNAEDENALEKVETPILDAEDFDYQNEEFVVDDTFIVQKNYTSNVADVNDYELIETNNPDYMKLTVENSFDATNSIVIIFSEEGKNEIVLRDNYYLEYDVMMEGNTAGTGFIDIQTANGNISLSDAVYGYDSEGIQAVSTGNLAGYANNKWYSRKIIIPEELAGQKIFRWTVSQRTSAPGARTVTYFANIRITDSEGNTVVKVEPNEENLTCRVIDKAGINDYTLKMSQLSDDQIHPQGDYLRFLITAYELEEGASSYINYAFSTAGRGSYKIKKGDVLIYKVNNINPFIKGSATVDIRFKDKTWLTDADIADQNGKSIWPSTDLRAEAGGFWYYRAIEIPDQYVGKTVDYFTFKTLNTVSLVDYEVQLADVKIINKNKTSLLIYGGGDVVGGLAAIRNADIYAMRNHSATDAAAPSGDYLRGTLYTHKSERITSNIKISGKTYTIQPGDYLEYDMTTFDGLLLNSGFGVDLDMASGATPSDYAWRDQNGLSAVPGIDVSNKASGRWYHRKIDLTDMAEEEIVGWRLVGEINSALPVPVDGQDYSYGFDNIRITNNGKTVFTVYENGAMEMSEVVRRVNCENSYVSATPYDNKEPIYEVPKFTLETKDTPVIAYNVKDFGAKADGKTDDTLAFQSALYAAERIGGGVVYAPAGRYAIKGNLYVPRTVQLRGEWQNPLENSSFKGTLLMAYAGRGDLDAISFITLGSNAAVSDLAIWYPEQKVNDIQPYPWTFHNHYGRSTIYNVTMFNSYRGVKYGNGTSGNQVAENVYATFLSRGLEIDCNFDLPRYNNVYVTPDVWAKSGLTDAPTGNSLNTLKNYLITNLEALRTGRVDGLSVYNLNIDYAKIGLLYDTAVNIEPMTITESAAFSNVTNFKLTNVNVGFQLNALATIGLAATKGSVEANQGSDAAAVKIKAYNAHIGFTDTVFTGTGHNIIQEGDAELNLQNITFKPASGKEAMVLIGGILNMNGCDFTNAPKAMKIESGYVGGTANGNISMSGITKPNGYNGLKIDDTPQEFEVVDEDEATHDEYDAPVAGTTTVYNIQKYGAKADGIADITAMIQKAIDDAAANGGGIVYFPGGKYRIDGNVVVKTGVELRGAIHSLHHSAGAATVFEIYGGYGDEDATATFRLEDHAGISGVTFFYPEQLCWDVVEFPWAIQSNGEGCWVTNTTFVNAWRGIDFYTNNADKHYIANIGGSFVDGGIFVGNSPTYGTLKNTQMVINYWSGYRDYGCLAESGNVMETETYIQTASRLVGYQFGDCRNESVLAGFTWIAQIGARFYDQGLGGFNGKLINYGTDAPYINLDVHAAENIVSLSPFMYVHGVTDYSSERTFLKSHKTNGGSVRIHNIIGHANGSCLDNFLIYNGKITIQQFAADSAKNYNANIQGGIVKLIGITNRPCTPAYGGGNPISLKVTRDVQKLTVIGWLDLNRDVRVTDEAGDRYKAYGMYSFNK